VATTPDALRWAITRQPGVTVVMKACSPAGWVRGAYFNDDLGPTVMLATGLPDGPMIFTIGHELKQHLVDRDLSPVGTCVGTGRASPPKKLRRPSRRPELFSGASPAPRA